VPNPDLHVLGLRPVAKKRGEKNRKWCL